MFSLFILGGLELIFLALIYNCPYNLQDEGVPYDKTFREFFRIGSWSNTEFKTTTKNNLWNLKGAKI